MLISSRTVRSRFRRGDGALALDAALIDGAGTVSSVGMGALESDDAVVAGIGFIGDVGALVAEDAAVNGAGVSSSVGTGALVAAAASIDGSGTVSTSYSPSYSNTGGTGNRSSIISVTASTNLIAAGSAGNLLNGNLTETNTWFNARTDGVLTFDFGSGNAIVLEAFKWYQSNNANHGTWRWQSSDDGSSWSNEGSTFTLDGPIGGGGKEHTEPNNTTTPHRYWRLIQVSGTASSSPFIYEIEFKLDGL